MKIELELSVVEKFLKAHRSYDESVSEFLDELRASIREKADMCV